MKTGKQRVLTSAEINVFPKGLQRKIEDGYYFGRPIEQLIELAANEGFHISKLKLEDYFKKQNLVAVKEVSQLPQETRHYLRHLYFANESYPSMVRWLRKNGYKVMEQQIPGFMEELKKEAALEEAHGIGMGQHDPLSSEVEIISLNRMLDFFLKFFSEGNQRPVLRSASDWEKIASAIVKIINVSMQRRKLQRDEQDMVNRVKNDLKSEMQKKLLAYPDLMLSLMEVIDRSSDEVMQ